MLLVGRLYQPSSGSEFRLLGAHVERCADDLREAGVNRPLGQTLMEGLRHAEVNHFRHRCSVVECDE